MVHDYGPGRCFASLHAEISYKEDVMLAHEVIDDIERMFREQHSIELVIHYDPVVTDDGELNQLRELVEARLREIDARLTAHDYRMVRGEGHSNLILDVVLPYDLVGKEGDIEDSLADCVQGVDEGYRVVITFDAHGFNGL
jgi:hypothetical protein